MRFKLALLPFLGALAGALFFIPPELFAQAQEVNPILPPAADPSNIEVYAQAVLDAARSPQKSLFVALLLIGVVFALREWGGSTARFFGWTKTAAFLASDRAGPPFVLALSMLGALVTALTAGTSLSWGLVMTATGVGLKAIGGFVGLKKTFGQVQP